MIINPFGYFLISLILYTFSRNIFSSRALFISLLKFELLFSFFKFNYGYFMNIGGIEIQYGEIIIGLLAIISFIQLCFCNINKRILFNSFGFLAFVLFGIFVLVLSPSDTETINFNTSGWDAYLRGDYANMQPVAYSTQSDLMFIRLISFIVILVAAKSILIKRDWLNIFNFLIMTSKIFILYGFFEIFVKFYLTVDLASILNSIFGRGIATGESAFRLQGFSREPSFYALALYNVIVLFILKIGTTGDIVKYIYWILASILIGVISGAFSFLWVFVCLAAFTITFLILRQEARNIIKFGAYSLSLTILMVPVLLIYINDINSIVRINEAIQQIKNAFLGTYVIGVDVSSEAARFISMFESFKSYLDRPLLGLGIGTTYCTSGIISILSNIGLFGLIYWIKLLILDYYKIRFLLGIMLFLPTLITNDLATLYDLSYVSLIALIYFFCRKDDYVVIKPA